MTSEPSAERRHESSRNIDELSDLRSAWILQLTGKSTAKLAGFSENSLASGFGKGENHLLVLERVQESDVVLIIDDNDGEDGPEQFQNARWGFRIELLALAAEQIPLEQTVGEQDEGDLIDDQTESPRREVFNAGEAFQLVMTFFNGGRSPYSWRISAARTILRRCYPSGPLPPPLLDLVEPLEDLLINLGHARPSAAVPQILFAVGPHSVQFFGRNRPQARLALMTPTEDHAAMQLSFSASARGFATLAGKLINIPFP